MNRETRIGLANQGNPEPLLLARKQNRRLSVQNNQLNSNWAKVRDSLDRIQCFAETKREREKNEMLKYQEKLQGNSGNFALSEISTINTPRRRSMSQSIAHEDVMKHTWFEKADKPRQRRFSIASDTLAQTSTVSSEKKRVFRRRAILSLLELQRVNEDSNEKQQERPKTFLSSLNEEPSQSRRESIFDDVEEVEPIRVPPSVRFPPIHQLQPAKLSTRNFEKDADFERKKTGELNDKDDLKYCRYIRNYRRKSIA